MADFKISYELTNKIEGGYSNLSEDKGGETYRGIARKSWGNWSGWIIIDRIKKEHPGATRKELDILLGADKELQDKIPVFYKVNFWDAMRLDEIAFQDIANEMYDSGVNFGIPPIIKRLQEAVNVTRTDIELTVDGKIGPNTIKGVNTHTDYKFLYKALNIIQGEAYMEIWRRDKTQEKFVKGWFTRVTFI